jgi:hypothetical protein
VRLGVGISADRSVEQYRNVRSSHQYVSYGTLHHICRAEFGLAAHPARPRSPTYPQSVMDNRDVGLPSSQITSSSTTLVAPGTPDSRHSFAAWSPQNPPSAEYDDHMRTPPPPALVTDQASWTPFLGDRLATALGEVSPYAPVRWESSCCRIITQPVVAGRFIRVRGTVPAVSYVLHVLTRSC